jgi:hypothetical protein
MVVLIYVATGTILLFLNSRSVAIELLSYFCLFEFSINVFLSKDFSSTRSSKTWLFQPTWLTQITNWHKVNNLVMNFCRWNIMNDLWINFHEWDQILNNIFHGWSLFCIEISWNFIHESATIVSTKIHRWHFMMFIHGM